MTQKNELTVFLVDDDALFLKSLEIDFLEHALCKVSTFKTGEDCIIKLTEEPHLIILDYHLDGIDSHAMNGLQTLDKIKHIKPEIPVVILSSQDKISVAVECLHHKAHDYVVKSETAFFRLQMIVDSLMKYQNLEKKLGWYVDRM